MQLNVTQAATLTALTVTRPPYVNPFSAISGNTITFTAAVGFAGVGIPTGTVTFASGGTTLGPRLPSSLLPADYLKQQFSTTSLETVGNYNVVAAYSADSNYIGSASAASSTIYVVAAQRM